MFGVEVDLCTPFRPCRVLGLVGSAYPRAGRLGTGLHFSDRHFVLLNFLEDTQPRTLLVLFRERFSPHS